MTLAWSPDNEHFATGGMDMMVYVWTVGDPDQRIKIPGRPHVHLHERSPHVQIYPDVCPPTDQQRLGIENQYLSGTDGIAPIPSSIGKQTTSYN